MKQILMLVFPILFTTIYVSGQDKPNFSKSKENKDLTEEIELVSKRSVPGTYLLTTFKSGYKVSIVLQKDSLYKYIVTTSSGETVPVTNIIQAATTTCWDCWLDTNGNTNCFKIPCPKSTKPWKSATKTTATRN